MDKRIACVLAMGLGIFGCATESNDPTRMEIVTPGDISLAVGDTSALWVVSKTYVDATGRTVTLKPYTSFSLISSDSTVAKVIRNQQIVGMAEGTATVSAHDDNSSLESETAATVTVEAP